MSREEVADALQSALRCLRNDRHAAARAHIQRALELDPTCVAAHRLSATLAVDTGDLPDAERILLDLLRADPDDPDLLAEYAWLMMRSLHLEKARALIAEALEQAPDHAHARLLQLHLDIIEDNTRGVERAAIDLLRDRPDSRSVAWTLFHVLFENHRYPAAIHVLEAILHADPTDRTAAESLIDIQAIAHWTSLPLRPLLKHGLAANITIWLVAILTATTLAMQHLVVPFAIVVGLFLLYCVYSWTWLHLLRRFLRARQR